jgi:hypothetical protein
VCVLGGGVGAIKLELISAHLNATKKNQTWGLKEKIPRRQLI